MSTTAPLPVIPPFYGSAVSRPERIQAGDGSPMDGARATLGP
jgi:hypothetical protein